MSLKQFHLSAPPPPPSPNVLDSKDLSWNIQIILKMDMIALSGCKG